MPVGAAIGVGALAAGGTITAAKMSSDANNNAQKTQAASTAAALDFSKQQEAERRNEWNYQQSQARAAWAARQQMLAPFVQGGAGVLAKYGFTGNAPAQMPAALTAPMPVGYAGGPIPVAPTTPGVSSMPMPTPVSANPAAVAPPVTSLGSMIPPGTGGLPMPGAPQTLSSMIPPGTGGPFQQSDWSKYGAPSA